MTGGEVKGIAADKKEMLVARAIASPKVLMLSGVGEGNALSSPVIRVIENLLG
jgi:choline dehydrogenase-like flavoprotein